MSDVDTDLKYIRRDLDKIMDKLDKNFVTKAEFAPVQGDVKKLQDNVVWLVRLLIGGVVLALLGLVINANV